MTHQIIEHLSDLHQALPCLSENQLMDEAASAFKRHCDAVHGAQSDSLLEAVERFAAVKDEIARRVIATNGRFDSHRHHINA